MVNEYEIKEIICLVCPLACRIEVKLNKKEDIISIRNNKCARGKVYAEEEILNPSRILTTTVYVLSQDKEHPLLPVQTDGPIPKNLIKQAMEETAKIKVKAPIKYREIIVENIANSGVNLVSTTERVY